MRCSKCGSEIIVGEKYCIECGNKISISALENSATHRKIYQKNWFIWIMLISFYPLGLFLLYKYSTYSSRNKIIIAGATIALLIYGRFSDNKNNDTIANNVVKTETVEQSKYRDVNPNLPRTIDEMENYLNANINNKDKVISFIFPPLTDNSNIRGMIAEIEMTKNISRNDAEILLSNIFCKSYEAIFESNLPIDEVTINIRQPDKKLAIGAYLGKNIALSINDKKWYLSNTTIDFINFCKKNTSTVSDNPADRCGISGFYAK